MIVNRRHFFEMWYPLLHGADHAMQFVCSALPTKRMLSLYRGTCVHSSECLSVETDARRNVCELLFVHTVHDCGT